MYYGADYYPEHWPRERWAVDAKLMKEAGFNLIRVAEFAWAKLEPEEGHWDFSWLDDALDVFYKEGIQVVMGTPTATPPKWLMDKHPSIYQVDENGLVQGFGSRRHYCYNNETYREYSEKIVENMPNITTPNRKAPTTLNNKWITAARFAVRWAPRLDKSAVTQVPIFWPSVM